MKQFTTFQDCQSCRECCQWQTPEEGTVLFTQEERSALGSQAEGIRFEPYGRSAGVWRVGLRPARLKAGWYVCPFLDEDRFLCKIYDRRPFDCQAWPFLYLKHEEEHERGHEKSRERGHEREREEEHEKGHEKSRERGHEEEHERGHEKSRERGYEESVALGCFRESWCPALRRADPQEWAAHCQAMLGVFAAPSHLSLLRRYPGLAWEGLDGRVRTVGEIRLEESGSSAG